MDNERMISRMEKQFLKNREAMIAVDQKKQKTILKGKECFVCYLDVDGFKDKVFSEPQSLYDTYMQQRLYMIASFFQATAISTEGEEKIELRHNDKLLWPYLFSDSWFFVSLDDSSESLCQISTAAAGIMMRCWEVGLPARGGIGGGKVWWNPKDQIMLGPAIVNAYETASSLDCFGVAVHPEVSQRASCNAFTRSFRTPIRRNKFIDRFYRPYINYEFACLKAHKTQSNWNTEWYLSKYDEIAREYSQRKNAKKNIIRRYGISRPLVELMLSEPNIKFKKT